MYRLGDDMAVRLPLVQGGANDVSTERTWLPRIAPHLPTPIPEVLGAGEPAEGYAWPWSVYQWLAGENPEAGALREPVLLAGPLGRAAHRTAVGPFHQHRPSWQDTVPPVAAASRFLGGGQGQLACRPHHERSPVARQGRRPEPAP